MDKNEKLLQEVEQHYQQWTDDNNKRMTRHNGWNDITDAYWGVLPKDWPYISRVVDPIIRTTMVEKNARIINNKLRGRLVPREGGDMMGAAVNNAILDFQWDNANDGGSMLTKLSISDMDARLYQTKFALVKWRYETDGDDVIFDGNEFYPLDIRDCGMDPQATHIRNAKWFQHRSWEVLEDLENQVDGEGKSMFSNISELKTSIKEKVGVKRTVNKTNEYTPRGLQIRGLEDHTGEDLAYPIVKIVTEYRNNKWIVFSPDYHLILKVTDNKYDHKKIPVAQLRYFPIQDDPLGESEVEPVLGIWLSVQAVVNGYLDEVILKMRPPLKIIENAARVETIIYGPEAQWLVDRQDAIEEMRSSGDSLQYFQTTYQALKSAFNVAMGDLSAQNISNFGPFEGKDKTATEIRATQQQQNTRDQKNQNDLGEFLEDVMMMWMSNNKQFLFSDPNKADYIIKLVGNDLIEKFKQLGLDSVDVDPSSAKMIADIIEQNPDMSPQEIQVLHETASMPRYPVVMNPDEKDITKLEVKAKMVLSDEGQSGELSVVPEDLDGAYNYIPDVQSMSLGANDQRIRGRTEAITLLTSNPTVLQLLQGEGYKPKVKDLLVADLEGKGLSDAERFFEKLNEQPLNQLTQDQAQANGGLDPNMQVPGLPGVPQANLAGGVQQQMAGPDQSGLGGGVPQAIQ